MSRGLAELRYLFTRRKPDAKTWRQPKCEVWKDGGTSAIDRESFHGTPIKLFPATNIV